MRGLFERLIAALPMHPRCRRALEETLADWKHEDETIDNRIQRWLCDLRSSASVLRALVMLSWWSPRTPLHQPFRASGTSARDEIIDLINNLSPDSSYEDILRELAAKRAKKESTEGSPAPKKPEPQRSRPLLVFQPGALKIAVAFLVVSLVGGLAQTYVFTPVMYAGTAQVRVEPDSQSVVNLATNPTRASVDPESFLETEKNVLSSRTLLRAVVRSLRLDRDPDFAGGRLATSPASGSSSETETPAEAAAVDTVAANLSVSVLRLSHLLTITYVAASPTTAANVANGLAKQYEQQNLARKRADVDGRLAKIREYVATMSAEIEVNQRNLIARTTEANVLDPETISANVEKAQTDMNVKTAMMQSVKSKMEEMQRLDPDRDLDGALKHPDIAKISVVSHLRNQLDAARGEKARLSPRFGSNAPQMRDVDQKIEQTEAALKVEIRNTADVARTAYSQAAQAANTARLIYEAQRRLQVESAKSSIPYQQLRLKILNDQNTLAEMSKQQKQLEILAQGIENNVSVIEFAQPATRPSTPKPAQILLLWIGAGLAVALAIILLRGRTLPAEIGFA